MRMVHRVGRSEGSLGPAGPTPRQEPLSHPSVEPAGKRPKHRSAQLQNQKPGIRISAKAWGRPAAHRAYYLTTNAFAGPGGPPGILPDQQRICAHRPEWKQRAVQELVRKRGTTGPLDLAMKVFFCGAKAHTVEL